MSRVCFTWIMANADMSSSYTLTQCVSIIFMSLLSSCSSILSTFTWVRDGGFSCDTAYVTGAYVTTYVTGCVTMYVTANVTVYVNTYVNTYVTAYVTVYVTGYVTGYVTAYVTAYVTVYIYMQWQRMWLCNSPPKWDTWTWSHYNLSPWSYTQPGLSPAVL